MRTVVGVFPKKAEAESVRSEFNRIGIPPDEVMIVEGPDSPKNHETEWSDRQIASTAAAGSSFGWFVAGLAPVVAQRTLRGAILFGIALGGALGMLGVSAVARIHAHATHTPQQALLGAMAGLAIGGILGAWVSAFYNLGVSHEKIALHREAEASHGVALAAHVREDAEKAALNVLEAHHARNARAAKDVWEATGWKGGHPYQKPYPSYSEYSSHQAYSHQT